MTKDRKRLIGLDLFRIASAIIIFLFHSIVHLDCNYSILQLFLSQGAVMMTGFFILSGFSLFYTYQNKIMCEISTVVDFYKKRAMGILPVYYFVAVAYIVLLGRKQSLLENIILMPIEVLGLQSVFSTLFPISHNDGTWFVSCILICYFIFPFLSDCIKQMKRKDKYILLILCTFILLYSPIVVRVFSLNNIYSNPFFRLLEFVVGILFASIREELIKNHFIKKYLLNKFTCILEILLGVIVISGIVQTGLVNGDYMLLSWIVLPIFLCLILALAEMDFSKVWNSKIVSYMNNITYVFFLAQFFVWKIVRKLCKFIGFENNMFKIVSSFLCCLCISVFMYEVIEKPAKKMVHKLKR